MLRVGLTGGIGAGKSAVSTRLAARGAVVIDADRLAREVVEPGTPGLAAVVEEFGKGVLRADGALDRARLADLVFSDDAARGRLNAIVHPLVGVRTAESMAAAPPAATVVYDVPLLFENGLAPAYHLVVVVEAPVAERVARVVGTRGMTPEAARARIAAQASPEQRLAGADVLLRNEGSLTDLDAVVDALWDQRLVPYAANLAAGRPAPAPATLVPYDPNWPAQYARAEARLRAALGERAVRIDHVGPTAVPGLGAEDMLDLQVTVRSPVVAGEVFAALAGSGWVQTPVDTVDEAPRAGGGSEAPRAGGGSEAPRAGGGSEPADPGFARHADPGRPARLHIRLDGAPGQRAALLVRDFLRAVPGESARYADARRVLAGRAAGGEPTGAALAAMVEEVRSRAEAWASDVGWR